MHPDDLFAKYNARAEAVAKLNTNYTRFGNYWADDGDYVLSHNEYARPEYRVYMGRDGYYHISERRYRYGRG
jgi:hypothetical protein